MVNELFIAGIVGTDMDFEVVSTLIYNGLSGFAIKKL